MQVGIPCAEWKTEERAVCYASDRGEAVICVKQTKEQSSAVSFLCVMTDKPQEHIRETGEDRDFIEGKL